MKQIFFFLLAFTFSVVAFAQVAEKRTGPSASVKQFLWQLQNRKVDEHGLVPNYVYYRDGNNRLFVNAFMKVNTSFSESEFRNYGVIKGTKAGNIWSVKIPFENFEYWTKHAEVIAMDMDQPAMAHLDSARRVTFVDSAHFGLGLPNSFNGNGVVVGVIDAGFDYSHPAFYDTSYQAYRVRKVWEQKTVGNPPPEFGYGALFGDSGSILTKAFDINDGTHGTHVAGIAGGSGIGSPANFPRRYRGVAYLSDLVFVAIYPTAEYWLNTGMADMLDGIKYTFDYAESQGKSAVANLSWGCPLGPRDGSSLFSQACNNITGPGKIFVVSGGNNGQNNIHLSKSFTSSDTIAHTFLTFPSSLTIKRNQVDIWGDTGKIFKVQFSLYSGNNKLTQTQWVELDGQTRELFLKGSNGDTVFITSTGVAEEFNMKPHMLLQFLSRINDRLCISVQSQSGTINMWQGIVVKTSGHYGTFTRYIYNWALNGDALQTTGDLVSTKSAIAVAAFNSKVSFVNLAGQTQSYAGYQRGRLSLFSSKGPTTDGRVKPDVSAPGLALASSVSSYDPTYGNQGNNSSSVVARYLSTQNGRSFPYAMAAGTSMAAPMTSGIVALLLQQYPELSPQELMSWFSETCITDNFTGIIPPGGNSSWGLGKINTMGLLRKAIQITGIQQFGPDNSIFVYPNPGNGNFKIAGLGSKVKEIRVINLQGREMEIDLNSNSNSLHSELSIDLSRLPDGIYLIQVRTDSGNIFARVLKN